MLGPIIPAPVDEDHHMNDWEVILELGAEGGSLTLTRISHTTDGLRNA